MLSHQAMEVSGEGVAVHYVMGRFEMLLQAMLPRIALVASRMWTLKTCLR